MKRSLHKLGARGRVVVALTAAALVAAPGADARPDPEGLRATEVRVSADAERPTGLAEHTTIGAARAARPSVSSRLETAVAEPRAASGPAWLVAGLAALAIAALSFVAGARARQSRGPAN